MEKRSPTLSQRVIARYVDIPQAVTLFDHRQEENFHDPVLINETLRLARLSDRGRFLFRVHPSLKEKQHLNFQAITAGNYVRVHRHEEIEKTEMFRLLVGEMDVVFLDTNENVTNVVRLSENGRKTCVVRPNQYHTVITYKDTVVLEAKSQANYGYNPETDKSFAPWSPEEGTPEANNYYNNLLELVKSYK